MLCNVQSVFWVSVARRPKSVSATHHVYCLGLLLSWFAVPFLIQREQFQGFIYITESANIRILGRNFIPGLQPLGSAQFARWVDLCHRQHPVNFRKARNTVLKCWSTLSTEIVIEQEQYMCNIWWVVVVEKKKYMAQFINGHWYMAKQTETLC